MSKSNWKPWMVVAGPLAVAGMLVGVTNWQNRAARADSDAPAVKTAQDVNAINQAKAISHAFRQAADAVSKSVVKIEAHTKAHAVSGASAQGENPFKGTPFEDMFRNLPEQNRQSPQRDSVGSGVIIDKAGLVLTNNHVVRGADEVTVVLADGTEYKATDIKTDPETDLAVLRLQGARDLPAARLGNSDELEVGDMVIAIGCPFQLDQTVTHGIISTKSREMSDLNRSRMLQTDAAINPGNSGGPLVNLDGEVVGINTAISTNNGDFQGVGFSIPINMAKWVVGQLVSKGHVARAYVGVKLEELHPDLAAKLGLKVGEGVLVADVVADGPAAKAGVHEGDVITGLNGAAIHSGGELRDMVERVPVGSKQTLDILRDGKSLQVELTTKELPQRLVSTAKGGDAEQAPAEAKTAKADDLGFEVADMSADEMKTAGDIDGVIVRSVTPDSPAARKGLQPGMVIRKVEHTTVKNVQQFEEAMKHQSAKNGVLLQVHTRNGNMFVVLQKNG